MMVSSVLVLHIQAHAVSIHTVVIAGRYVWFVSSSSRRQAIAAGNRGLLVPERNVEYCYKVLPQCSPSFNIMFIVLVGPNPLPGQAYLVWTRIRLMLIRLLRLMYVPTIIGYLLRATLHVIGSFVAVALSHSLIARGRQCPYL